jgi:uncharacterized phage protein gp47/JayE
MTTLPTLLDLFNGVISSMQVQFGAPLPLFGRSLLRGLAGSWSGQLKSVYNAVGNVQKNIWFDTADPESMGGTLERFGRIYLLRNPYPATQGQYTVAVTGDAGAVIEAQTTFLSDIGSLSPNLLYVLDTTYTLTGTDDSITLRALTAGTKASLLEGNTLTATKPLANISQGVTVTAVTVNPIDAETVEQYRAAIGLHVQLAPQGGADPDYRIWGSEFPGVAKIYPYTPGGTPWQVNVYVEAILSDSVGPPYYGVPTPTILAGVTDYINTDPNTGLKRKPMGVVLGPSNVGAIAVTVYQVAIAFTGASSISSADQTTIKNALVEAINKIRPFIAGCDNIADRNDTLSVSLPATTGGVAPPESYVIVAIAMTAVPGVLFTGVTMTVNGTPATAYTFDNGIIPFLDPTNVTFS